MTIEDDQQTALAQRFWAKVQKLEDCWLWPNCTVVKEIEGE